MKVDREVENGVDVVSPAEKRIDAAVAVEFKGFLTEVVAKGTAGLIIDLSRVEFIDSSGLGCIISALKKIGDKGNLRIASARGQVADMFDLTRLDKVFQLYDSKESALAAF